MKKNGISKKCDDSNIDDSKWDMIDAGIMLGNQGYPNLDGRADFFINNNNIVSFLKNISSKGNNAVFINMVSVNDHNISSQSTSSTIFDWDKTEYLIYWLVQKMATFIFYKILRMKNKLNYEN